jgi:hypothetical protein
MDVIESQENTYLGLLTLTGLILAMASQPIAGMRQANAKT